MVRHDHRRCAWHRRHGGGTKLLASPRDLSADVAAVGIRLEAHARDVAEIKAARVEDREEMRRTVSQMRREIRDDLKEIKDDLRALRDAPRRR